MPRHPQELPGRPVPLHTSDGRDLNAWWLPSSPSTRGHDLSAVLLHGFTGSLRRQDLVRVARRLALAPGVRGVLVVEQRGHGGSTGRSTLGDTEVFDVDAAIRAVRAMGSGRVVTVGWSMGGTSALRHAAFTLGAVETGGRDRAVHERPDAVVVASTVSRWDPAESTATRRLDWLVNTAPGRLVSRILGARVDPGGWPDPQPLAPVDAAAVVGAAGIPVLVVHGEDDQYFSVEHGRRLAEAARGELWLVPGFGHGEQGADDALLDRIGTALQHLSPGS